MNKDKLNELLAEAGVPEDKIAEMSTLFDAHTQEIERQHREGVNEPIPLGGGIYLSHLMSQETDWRKKAALAAAILKLHIDD